MKYIPKSVSRFAHLSTLKVSAKSPTILVVSGVVGLGATAVLAARASRKTQSITDAHAKARAEIGIKTDFMTKAAVKERQQLITALYMQTSVQLLKVYGPTIAVGTVSAASVLWGHNILKGRHVATMAAYSGMMEQFTAYRERVRKTLGDKAELDIFKGAHGEWVEDPDHKGEHKLQPKYDDDANANYSYFQPWWDETNDYFKRDPEMNKLWLKGVQAHQNRVLEINGFVFLNDVLKDLKMKPVPEGQIMGWMRESKAGDGFIDFGFMTGNDPHTIAFREAREPTVRLNFNVDNEPIWNQI